MAGTFVVSTPQVGSIIDSSGGKISQISYLSKPTGFDAPAFDPGSGFPARGYFTLIDGGANPLGTMRPLISVEATNSGFAPGNVLSFSNFPFSQLKLQSCPPGASFQIITV
jgi:hypothetical protein